MPQIDNGCANAGDDELAAFSFFSAITGSASESLSFSATGRYSISSPSGFSRDDGTTWSLLRITPEASKEEPFSPE